MALFDIKDQPGKTKLPTLKNRLYLALLSDADIDGWPPAVAAAISTNVLLPNKTYKFIDTLTDTINANAQPGESPYTGYLILTPTLEGLSKQTLDWLYQNLGTRVIAVWERCSDGQKFIGGSPCSGGLVVKFTSVGALDGSVAGAALSLEGGDCPEPFWFYDGPIPRQAPATVNIVGGEFALQDASQYLIADNAAATALTDITGVTDADVGASSSCREMELYQIRWSIEVMFKECKQYLRPGKAQNTDFYGQIADVSLTLITYLILTLQKRFQSYETLGEIFRHTQTEMLERTLCERILDVFLKILEQLLEILSIDVDEAVRKIMTMSLLKATTKNRQALPTSSSACIIRRSLKA